MKRASILAVVLAFAMLFTANAAFALTDNNVTSTPKVQDDSGQTLGTIVIKEDEDSAAKFGLNEYFTITLPSGVEYDNVTDAVYGVSKGDTLTDGSNLDQYFGVSDASTNLTVKAVADNYVTLEITTSDSDYNDKIFAYFNGDATVDVDSDVTGDIKAEIDGTGTSIKSEFVTVGRTTDGDTVTTVSDTTDLPFDQSTEIEAIKIQENTAGVLKNNGEIELKLPNDYEWDLTNASIDDVGVTLDTLPADLNDLLSDDKDTLTVNVASSGSSSGTQGGFITVTGAEIYVPDDADLGDEVEVTVDGDDVTKEDVVIGTVADYGFDVHTDGDIETVIAGQEDQDIAEIHIDDLVDTSWIEDRTVRLELPSWASFVAADSDAPLSATDEDLNDDKDELKLTVDSSPSGEAELNDLTVNVDADAPAGDLTVKISGSAGVEAELVVAKVEPAFVVSAEKPEFKIGVQKQQLGDITISETTDGAIEEGKWIVVEAPNGMYFNDTPSIDVTEGDIDVDDEDIDDNIFAFRVTGESVKEASAITISDIVMDLDRTVPVGDITFDVYMTKAGDDNNGDNYVTDIVKKDFDLAIDHDNYDDVTDVVVGEVVTPAPDEAGNSAAFTIGSSIYNVNGTMKAMDAAPYVKDGRTFTPVRYVAEALGAAVDYDAATKTVTLTKGDDVVTLVLGSTTITVNGTASQMDVAAEVNNGRTMLPARFVAEAFGYNVGFDAATKAVVISK